MEGFVIQFTPDDSNLPIVFWSGSAGLENLNQSNLYSDIASARMDAGDLQKSYTGYSISIVPAFKGITLSSHVATS